MMNWFDGNVVEAIQLSKSRKSIFLVCIIGNLFTKFCFGLFSIFSNSWCIQWVRCQYCSTF